MHAPPGSVPWGLANQRNSEQSHQTAVKWEHFPFIQVLTVDQSLASFQLTRSHETFVILKAFGQGLHHGHMREVGFEARPPPSRRKRLQACSLIPVKGGEGRVRPGTARLCHPAVQATAAPSGWRNVPKARRLDAGDVVLPVEVSLHMVGTAVVPVQGLHGLVYAPPIDRGHQHPHGPLALLSRVARTRGQLTPPWSQDLPCVLELSLPGPPAHLHTCNLLPRA